MPGSERLCSPPSENTIPAKAQDLVSGIEGHRRSPFVADLEGRPFKRFLLSPFFFFCGDGGSTPIHGFDPRVRSRQRQPGTGVLVKHNSCSKVHPFPRSRTSSIPVRRAYRRPVMRKRTISLRESGTASRPSYFVSPVALTCRSPRSQ